MDVTKPYKFIGFGAMDVTKPYKCPQRDQNNKNKDWVYRGLCSAAQVWGSLGKFWGSLGQLAAPKIGRLRFSFIERYKSPGRPKRQYG